MLSFPNAKINLGLHILSKRADGYHEIDTCFYPIYDTVDALEILHADSDSLELLSTTADIPIEKNLVWKAMQAIRAESGDQHKYQVILQKHIPSGAGLGGGSADAAWTLRMIDELSDLNLPQETMQRLALQLGADVPFFLENKPAIAGGIGEILSPVNLDLSGYDIRLVDSDIHISTAWAFGGITPRSDRKTIREIIEQPIETWKDQLYNDFEEVVFPKYPQLADTKQKLYEEGAVYASLTGTGSTVYGLFRA